jgi:3-oxoacyl-(acyl-carrier-protein) synthase
MSLHSHILGTGIVTSLGAGVEPVLLAERAATPTPTTVVTNPETGRTHYVATVPTAVSAHLGREPRLRRASAISMLAATAAQSAIAASGIVPGPRTALVVGVSNGCAQYTRRFYEQIVKTGANTASPLLFPETVHNAPASHLAAMLKLDGATYTLIGDATVGMQAVHFGAQLLAMGDADNVIIAAAEELDWILSEGHHVWRLTSRDGTCRPDSGGGTLLAEGAAAIVLGQAGGAAKIATSEGSSVLNRGAASAALHTAISQLGDASADWIVDGANGTSLDSAFASNRRTERRFSPKMWVGEAIGASALQQIVIAGELLARTGTSTALVPALGWNQQASAALVQRVG